MKPTLVECNGCGETFSVRPGVVRRYCSQRCYWNTKADTSKEFNKLGKLPRNKELNLIVPGSWESKHIKKTTNEEDVRRFDEMFNGCAYYY